MEKLSRRHLINSSDVFVIKGFTVFYKDLFLDSKIPEDVRKSNEEKLAQSETEVQRLADALTVLASLQS